MKLEIYGALKRLGRSSWGVRAEEENPRQSGGPGKAGTDLTEASGSLSLAGQDGWWPSPPGPG